MFVDPDDRPTQRIVRGRVAALLKETLCRVVPGSLRIERLFGGAFSWPRGRGVSAERAPRDQMALGGGAPAAWFECTDELARARLVPVDHAFSPLRWSLAPHEQQNPPGWDHD